MSLCRARDKGLRKLPRYGLSTCDLARCFGGELTCHHVHLQLCSEFNCLQSPRDRPPGTADETRRRRRGEEEKERRRRTEEEKESRMLRRLSRALWNYRSIALVVSTPLLLLPLPLVIGTKVSLVSSLLLSDMNQSIHATLCCPERQHVHLYMLHILPSGSSKCSSLRLRCVMICSHRHKS